MTTALIHIGLLTGAFLVLFAVAELLHRKAGVAAEVTRKIVHIGTGLITLLFPLLLDSHWQVLLLCASFAVLLALSLRLGLLPSINAIERRSVGSLAYPFSVYGCFLVFEHFGHRYLYFYLPVLILAVCDPVAAGAGRKWPLGRYRVGSNHKTLMGSLMFLLSAVVLSALAFHFLPVPGIDNYPLLVAPALIAMLACITEALSRDGYDNLTIPVSVLSGLFILNSFA